MINIKVARVGGLTETRRIQALGGEKGVESWCGGMVDAGVARGHNIAAATLPHYVYPNDNRCIRPHYGARSSGHRV